MISVFISYSRQDKDAADFVAEELRKRGADVFVDYQRLEAGENFVTRLGAEIGKRDFFILLFSPRSEASKWVQAEVLWAVRNNKTIIPVILEPASFSNFFILISLEQIDFTRWLTDKDVTNAVTKLIRALGLKSKPSTVHRAKKTKPKKPLHIPEIAIEETKEEKTVVPEFAKTDIIELFTDALEISNTQPEKALYLYQQILKINPDFMKEKIEGLIVEQERLLRERRVTWLIEQSRAFLQGGQLELAIQIMSNLVEIDESRKTYLLNILFCLAIESYAKGKWGVAKNLSNKILDADEDNVFAQRLLAALQKNPSCDSLYQQAYYASKQNRWKAVETILQELHAHCNEFGDPEGILANKTIDVEWVRCISNIRFISFSHPVTSLVFTNNCENILVGLNDGEVRLVNFSSRWGGDLPDQNLDRESYTSVPENIALISDDDSLVVSFEYDKESEYYDRYDYYNIVLSEISNKTIKVRNSITAYSGSRYALVGTSGYLAYTKGLFSQSSNVINLFNINNKDEKRVPLMGNRSGVTCLVFAHDQQKIISGAEDGYIISWDVNSGQMYSLFKAHDSEVVAIVFSKQGDIISASKDGMMKVPGQIKPIKTGLESIRSMAISADGTLLAIGSKDGQLQIWQIKDTSMILTLQAHSKPITSVAFSSNGKMLATGSADKNVKLWALTGKVLPP